MNRTPRSEEAILLASQPNEAREYLEERAKNASRFFDPIGVETEAELLSRKDRLLDLTLAEFCLHRETAQALFERDPEDGPIRDLVLSNEALAKASFRGFPECLFGSKEAILDFLKTASPDERARVFSNPSIDETFLEDFLSLGDFWQAMDPEQRLWALDNLAANEKMRRKRSTSDYDDGWDWYTAGKPFEAAWSLIKTLEPGEKTASHLGNLLRDLPSDSYDTDGIEKAIDGWRTPDDLLEKEAEENKKGRLSDFQEVRQAGARLLSSKHDATPGAFLDRDDVALRCGAYEGERHLDVHAMKAAVERDGDLARVHLIRNENIWRQQKTRDALLDVALHGADTDEPRWEYRRCERQHRKDTPEWFADEDYREPDERPLSEASIHDLVEGIASGSAVNEIHRRLGEIQKAQQVQHWMIIAFAILMAIALR